MTAVYEGPSEPRDGPISLGFGSFNIRNCPATNMADSAVAYEQQNVHEVYQQIAGHFSATRYKVRLLAIRFRLLSSLGLPPD